jgi:uncharacterized membrane protein YraQ (UPF0718 family)/YHS domain-containing protein
MRQLLNWLWQGGNSTLAMTWVVYWPLVLGFSFAGIIQAVVPRNRLAEKLEDNSLSTAAAASLLGAISSSCSYAASALARTLYLRGTSFRNAMIFMIASTNLVVELGVVLANMLGWKFLVAQLLGGIFMISIIVLLFPLFFRTKQLATLTSLRSEPAIQIEQQNSSTKDAWVKAAKFTKGDLSMVKWEIAIGMIVAGFLSAHIPASWWSDLFLSGHGIWSIFENTLIAPPLAIISFVCSVGNIPLAALLWTHGADFGGVISFVFADLVTLPLLLIYRRFYGTKIAIRLLALFWLSMSAAGLLVDGAFATLHALPRRSLKDAVLSSHPTYSLGATLWLNIVASVVLILILIIANTKRSVDGIAIDPICHMAVSTASPAAVRTTGDQVTYFCSPSCAEKFDRGEIMTEVVGGDAIDPICKMQVNSKDAIAAKGEDGKTQYFCSLGCREAFLSPPTTMTSIQLGNKPK